MWVPSQGHSAIATAEPTATTTGAIVAFAAAAAEPAAAGATAATPRSCLFGGANHPERF